MQSLADVESLSEGQLSSGEDVSSASWDDNDGSFIMDAHLPDFPPPDLSGEDSSSSSAAAPGFFVDGVLSSGSSGGDRDVPAAVPSSNAGSSSSRTAAGADAEADESLSPEAVDPPTHQALTSLVRRLRLTVRRFEPSAMLSALRSLEALSQSGAHLGTASWCRTQRI